MVQSLLYHTASVVALTKTFSGEFIQCYKCILDPLVTACPFKRVARTYLRLPRRLGRHSFPASRRDKPRLTAVEKKC